MANSSNLAYCLEYSDHKTDMMDAFDDYLRNESMVDVMLSCEGNTIKAHKMVLSAGSTYFRNIFGAFKNPFQIPVLIIKDMPFRDLKAIVEFLYRGEVVVPVEQVSSLSKSAQTLFIRGLEHCFNKSAMVNVQTNHNSTSNSTANSIANSTANSTANINRTNTQTNNEANSSSGQTKQNSMNKQKSKVKPKKETNRSIAMRLRNTRRPDYKQLSNGDFNSDEDCSEIEFNGYPSKHRLSQTSDPKSTKTNDENSAQVMRQIKSELIYQMTDSDENQNTNKLSVAEDSDNSVIDDEDNCSDIMCDSDIERIDTETRETEFNPMRASTSKSLPSPPMPPLTRKPVINTQRNFKTGLVPRNRRKAICGYSNNRSQNIEDIKMPSLRPIKTDSEKTAVIHCSMCPRVFSQSSSLRTHMKRIHGEENKEHTCHLCGKKYSWRSGLYKHMRSHRE